MTLIRPYQKAKLASVGLRFRRWRIWKCFSTVSHWSGSQSPKLSMHRLLCCWQCTWWSQKSSGTLQNDILKEYIAQKEWIYPIRPAMKLVTDTFQYCTEHVPRYNPVSVSGYHIREAGSTAIQELAFTLRDGLE